MSTGLEPTHEHYEYSNYIYINPIMYKLFQIKTYLIRLEDRCTNLSSNGNLAFGFSTNLYDPMFCSIPDSEEGWENRSEEEQNISKYI